MGNMERVLFLGGPQRVLFGFITSSNSSKTGIVYIIQMGLETLVSASQLWGPIADPGDLCPTNWTGVGALRNIPPFQGHHVLPGLCFLGEDKKFLAPSWRHTLHVVERALTWPHIFPKCGCSWLIKGASWRGNWHVIYMQPAGSELCIGELPFRNGKICPWF